MERETVERCIGSKYEIQWGVLWRPGSNIVIQRKDTTLDRTLGHKDNLPWVNFLQGNLVDPNIRHASSHSSGWIFDPVSLVSTAGLKVNLLNDWPAVGNQRTHQR